MKHKEHKLIIGTGAIVVLFFGIMLGFNYFNTEGIEKINIMSFALNLSTVLLILIIAGILVELREKWLKEESKIEIEEKIISQQQQKLRNTEKKLLKKLEDAKKK